MPIRREPYTDMHLAEAFPLATEYRLAISPGRKELREGGPLRASLPFSERHLQCVWFNPELRPKRLFDSRGEEVTVIDPGRWNLESGPDFIGAVLETTAERRRVCGDVEIHIDPADWIGHGHLADPRYADVCAHATYFSGELPSERLPAGALQISLKKALMSNPYFAFENIDVTAYPYDLRNRPKPCAEVLSAWDRERKESLLASAGEERMLRKAERFQNSVNEFGVDQAIYIQVMRALGYKQNSAGFKYISDNIPAARLRGEAEGDTVKAYALLMGMANLLPSDHAADWDEQTARFVRKLWDHWWRLRERWERLAIDPECWCRSGVRPQNRIERRLMAAAAIFGGNRPLSERWREKIENGPDHCVGSISRELTEVDGGYWRNRLAWSGKIQERGSALIGRSRASAIVNNVFIPYAACIGRIGGEENTLIEQMPPEPTNSIMRATAYLLFGPDHPPSIYKTAIRRQGLMQVFHDFCLQDRSGCRECELPRLLRESTEMSAIAGDA